MHEIENNDVVVLKGKRAWHNLGVVIQDELTAMQAARRFGMLWEVEQHPLFAQGNGAANELELLRQALDIGAISEAQDHLANFHAARHFVDSHVANVRADDNSLLGIVGDGYSVCQNQELAEFTDALAQTGKVTIETCGTIKGGKRIWFLAKGDAFSIGGDQVHPYLMVSNSHDGGGAIRVTPTTVRTVCSNTFHMVVPRYDDESGYVDAAKSAYVMRHTGRIANKLGEAKKALANYGEVLRRNREMFEAMNSQVLDKERATRAFVQQYADNWDVADDDMRRHPQEDVRKLAGQRDERLDKAVDQFMRRLSDEAEVTGNMFSRWAVFNGLTGYVQHDLTARGKDDVARIDRRVESNLFGLGAQRTHAALDIVMGA